MSWLYRFGRGVLCPIFRLMLRFRVEGLENVPTEGGVLLVANHASWIDPPILGCAMTRPVHFMAKAELFKMPFFNWALPRVYAFPVRRGETDRSAIQTAIKLLNAGNVVGIFPEGTRTRTGELVPPRRGAGFIALKASVPVIPVGIAGTYRAMRWRGLLPRFSRVVVRIGEPIDFSELSGEDDVKERSDRAAAMMMERIARLLEK